MAHFVYADNAATTAVSKEVLDEMIPYFCDKYGNPSSIYSKGRETREAVDTARKRAADALGAQEQEIFFTSGGSEADNWAIRGIAQANVKKGKHLITTKFEHHAVLHTMKALEKEGFEVTYLNVNSDGIVKPSDLEAAIRPDTTLVSIMYANNEIGTIQPIPELAKICKDKGVVFHTDAVQAVGHVKINVKEQNIDLLSLSAHKFHGPKGVGALYIRKGLRFPNLIEGGAQEKNRRAGTENVPGIVGLGKAIELACASIDENAAKVSRLRDKLIEGALKIPYTRLNGDPQKRLPGNVNISVEGIEGESLLLLLDMNNICASSGSACTSGSLDPSHVLLAIGLKHEVAHGSLRFSLSELNTEEDVDYILEKLPQIVERLRAMSPVWEDMMKNK
ncbi:MAG TPA: cysteine desulfurase NifS [Ruminiclostridium sp.]|nr:cysteine desulfurase NifS [Ruminiclostridium sp.]